MPFGEYRDEGTANLADTIDLRAQVYTLDNDPYPESDLFSVTWEIKKPDGTRETVNGEIYEGEGRLLYGGTNQVGNYTAVARFRLASGEIKSVRVDFTVVDPFEVSATPEQRIADAVWLRLEDCFDSEHGGPWLRDVTLSFFNKRKIIEILPDAMLEINIAPPQTNVAIGEFTTVGPNGELDPDMPVLIQAALVATIRHLMRSYVEQPLPQGAQVVYEDRRDYLQRWQAILQVEQERLTRWIALWKRQFLGLGKSALLVSSKAGRLIPAPMRTRNVGRGYY